MGALLGQDPRLLDVRHKDWPHHTLLIAASKMGHLSVVWVLLTRGVDVNARHVTVFLVSLKLER